METVRVLVVDDDETILRIISSFLNHDGGYTVLTTSSPQEALEIARNSPVDLLITDIMMPGLLGSKLFHEIRQLSPKTACIMISGYSEEMYNLPSDTLFLHKPFDSRTLLAVIRKALV
jgi:two-component system cell cycle sensor histidine kinase/response regulator CckA